METPCAPEDASPPRASLVRSQGTALPRTTATTDSALDAGGRGRCPLPAARGDPAATRGPWAVGSALGAAGAGPPPCGWFRSQIPVPSLHGFARWTR